jgi:hypothetical protein
LTFAHLQSLGDFFRDFFKTFSQFATIYSIGRVPFFILINEYEPTNKLLNPDSFKLERDFEP